MPPSCIVGSSPHDAPPGADQCKTLKQPPAGGDGRRVGKRTAWIAAAFTASGAPVDGCPISRWITRSSSPLASNCVPSSSVSSSTVYHAWSCERVVPRATCRKERAVLPRKNVGSGSTLWFGKLLERPSSRPASAAPLPVYGV